MNYLQITHKVTLKRNIVVKVHWRFVIGAALRFAATAVLLVVLRLV